jgi:hypothetical protein
VISLQAIRDKVRRRRYEFSRHAVDQSMLRGISVAEVEEALLSRSEVIEDYPDDKRGPTCLILGLTNAGRPLHIQVSHPSRPVLKIVTLYEPDRTRWTDFRRRKNPQ